MKKILWLGLILFLPESALTRELPIDINIEVNDRECSAKLRRKRQRIKELRNSLAICESQLTDRDDNLRELNRLREENRELRLIIEDLRYGDDWNEVSTIYYCNNRNDPQLIKSIIDENGATLRETVVKTFTKGSDEDETENCRVAALSSNYSINFGSRTECLCNRGGDPKLVLQVLDSRFQTIKTITLGSFVRGGDEDERRACERATQIEAICKIIR